MSISRSIENTTALYGKLMRTFARRTEYGKFQLDWVFDMAMTAWHLVDWYAVEKGENLFISSESA